MRNISKQKLQHMSLTKRPFLNNPKTFYRIGYPRTENANVKVQAATGYLTSLYNVL